MWARGGHVTGTWPRLYFVKNVLLICVFTEQTLFGGLKKTLEGILQDTFRAKTRRFPSYQDLAATPANREIVFHSESGICTIVSQPCFTTRNLRTKLCGIRSQTEEQEFVDPFKSWYLEALSVSEMENRRASPGPRLGEGLN